MHWPAIIYFRCCYKTQVSFLGHCWKQKKKNSLVFRWPKKPQVSFTTYPCRLFLPVHDSLAQGVCVCSSPWLGAALTLQEPHGWAGVCPGQLSTSRVSSQTFTNIVVLKAAWVTLILPVILHQLRCWKEIGIYLFFNAFFFLNWSVPFPASEYWIF